MNRPFVPNFLKKIDKNLLLNKPDTWSTRIHLVIYYSILFSVVLGAICTLAPFEPRAYNTIYVWTIFICVICFIGTIIWLIYLLRFNVFKRFGTQKNGSGIRTFLFFFISISFIILPAYIPSIVDCVKTNMCFGSTEIVNDANAINTKICQINYNILPLKWDADSVRLVKDDTTKIEEGNTEVMVDSTVSVISNVTNVTAAQLKEKIAINDSVVQLKDSLFIIYSCPTYVFVDASVAATHTPQHVLTSIDIYRSVVSNFKPVDRAKTAKELNDLLTKYRILSSDFLIADYGDPKKTYTTKINSDYHLGAVNQSIWNICERKYRSSIDNLSDYFQSFFYVAFVLTVLLFIFRHTTIKVFFLTFLAGTILFIITAVIITFSRLSEQGVFSFILGYYFLALIMALSISVNIKQSTSKGIALNLVTFFTSYIPSVLVALYYFSLHGTFIDSNTVSYQETFKYEHLYTTIAKFAGIIIFVILIGPLFKRIYRKWYALPED